MIGAGRNRRVNAHSPTLAVGHGLRQCLQALQSTCTGIGTGSGASSMSGISSAMGFARAMRYFAFPGLDP